MRNLIVIFGDQLHKMMTSLDDFDKSQDHILMAEVWEEATHVAHHKKKLIFIFSAMRHFAKELRDEGYELTYVQLDEHKQSSFETVLEEFLKNKQPQKIIVTAPSEYRVLEKVKNWPKLYSVDLEIKDDKRFLCSKQDFQQWLKNK